MSLGPGQVHVWVAAADERVDGRLASWEGLLSAEERARHQRLRLVEDRREYITAHALVRRVLSKYADVAPWAWSFSAGLWGRPEIAASSGAAHLRFSLSHTRGLSTCVVASDRQVGIDVEHVRRMDDAMELADRYFAAEEATALRAVPASNRADVFLRYWTLKEAYAKARGLGLRLALDALTFHLRGDDGPVTAQRARDGEDPARWQFAQYRPTPSHVLAIAARRCGSQPPMQIAHFASGP